MRDDDAGLDLRVGQALVDDVAAVVLGKRDEIPLVVAGPADLVPSDITAPWFRHAAWKLRPGPLCHSVEEAAAARPLRRRAAGATGP